MADVPPGDGPEGGVDATAPDADTRCEDGSPVGNLVSNWSFECGITAWATEGGCDLESTSSVPAHSGMYSAHVYNRAAAYNGPLQDLSAVIRGGGTYSASAWGMVPPQSSGTTTQLIEMTATFQCIGDPSPTYVSVGQATAVPGAWVEVAGAFTVPQCQFLDVGVYVNGPDPGIDLYVDDMVVQ
jgi:hypothetical protein